MPGTRGQRSEVGQRISAAKKGKPLVARGPNEITRQEAVREFGLSAKVLLEGADRQLRFERGESSRPGLRHRRLPHANGGEVILFDRTELAEDLARLPCQWCDQPAPGNSRRCRRHQAKKYGTVELVCDWEECPRGGEPFMRYGSVHRFRAARGDKHGFCSDRCELLWLKANHERFASPHAQFDADYADKRYKRLEPQFKEMRVELGLPLRLQGVAEETRTSPSVIRMHAPELGGKVIELEGASQWAFPSDAPGTYLHNRALQEREQKQSPGPDYLHPDHAAKQQQRTRRLLLNKGLSKQDVDTIIRRRAEARRSLIRRHAGRPKRLDLSERLLTFAEEVVEECPDLGLNDVLATAGLRSWQENPVDWPRDRYPAARRDKGSYDPKMRKNVVERVRFLVGSEIEKSLLFAASKPRRPLS
jgi:hypothetical protein